MHIQISEHILKSHKSQAAMDIFDDALLSHVATWSMAEGVGEDLRRVLTSQRHPGRLLDDHRPSPLFDLKWPKL